MMYVLRNVLKFKIKKLFLKRFSNKSEIFCIRKLSTEFPQSASNDNWYIEEMCVNRYMYNDTHILTWVNFLLLRDRVNVEQLDRHLCSEMFNTHELIRNNDTLFTYNSETTLCLVVYGLCITHHVFSGITSRHLLRTYFVIWRLRNF